MFTWFIIITVLALLYGLAWHNQPAKEPGRGSGGTEGAETRGRRSR